MAKKELEILQKVVILSWQEYLHANISACFKRIFSNKFDLLLIIPFAYLTRVVVFFKNQIGLKFEQLIDAFVVDRPSENKRLEI